MKPLIDEEKIGETEKFFDEFHRIEMEYLRYWQENTVWHWEFWVSVFLTIIPWVLWFIFRKRGSEARLLLAGSFVVIIASWLDFLGVAFGMWHYTGKALPTIPTYAPWDFSLLPVTIMFWLQFKPALSPFLKAIIYSALCSFIGEPFFEWMGLYSPDKWNSFYSFPAYVVIYLLAYQISKSKSFDKL